jgi:hypothetical protein
MSVYVFSYMSVKQVFLTCLSNMHLIRYDSKD